MKEVQLVGSIEIFMYFPFDQGFHTHSDEPIVAGSMQDKFRVEAWRGRPHSMEHDGQLPRPVCADHDQRTTQRIAHLGGVTHFAR